MNESLIRSSDRKVANGATKGGGVKMRNTFGLPAGLSCPGMTAVCETICYAKRTQVQYPNVDKAVMHNWTLLQLATVDRMYSLIHEMISEFVTECDKKKLPKLFRIHWDGDFFAPRYATAWAAVVRAFPDVMFWAYTRTFDVVGILADIPNLTLYLSADSENMQAALTTAAEYPTVLIATLGDTFEDAGKSIDPSRKVYKCPENRRTLELISEKGSACVRCGICIDGRGDVLFSKSKR